MTMFYGGCHIRVSFEQIHVWLKMPKILITWLLQKNETKTKPHTSSSATIARFRAKFMIFSSLKRPYLCCPPGYVLATLELWALRSLLSYPLHSLTLQYFSVYGDSITLSRVSVSHTSYPLTTCQWQYAIELIKY